MKKILFYCLFIFSSLLLSCEKNEMDGNSVIHDYRLHDILYAKDSKLKRVYHASEDDRILYAEYKYDESGRISRIDYDGSYETYLYNAKEELEKILTYNKNTSGLISTLVCTYNAEGNKIKDQITSENEQMLGHYIVYQYTDGKLTKQEIVVGSQLPQYILYEYKGNKLVKTKSYFLGSANYDITENFYDQNLLVHSIGYQYYENTESGFKSSEVKRYYDRNDNLIKRVVNDYLSGSHSYITKYDNFNTWEYEYE